MVRRVKHIVVQCLFWLGEVEVDQLEAGRGLHPQPLGALAGRVLAPGEHVAAQRVEMARHLVTAQYNTLLSREHHLMPDAGVAAGDEDRLPLSLVLAGAHQPSQQPHNEPCSILGLYTVFPKELISIVY